MTKLKNAIVKIIPDLEIELRNLRLNGSFEGCSGFVTSPVTGKVAYVSTDTHLSEASTAMYRTATISRDFTGGFNRFTGYAELPQPIVDLVR
ncbi:hypothetical protein SAMN06295974_3864 [Plantibacter flavus]|uniref:Uncharacterized protein n=2 Tax=Plantibacter flavus TaxID=150123 RepID=A0A3N2BL39_9MICO|nr:hypothetical protein EDD42_3942 [Plantibacter flavus]SMG49562.1 hypothetical protein SAMN06295974_3864 [Plantibacter flavus]